MIKRLFIIGCGLFGLACSFKKEISDYNQLYFGDELFAKDSSDNTFYSRMLTGVLTDLEEESLERNRRYESYRLTTVPSVGGSYVIRVAKNLSDSTLEIYYKRLNGFETDKNKIDVDLKKYVGNDENPFGFDSLEIVLNNLEFWTLNHEWKCDSGDGTSYFLEGFKNNEYHLICRWSPELCDYENAKYLTDLILYFEKFKRVQ